MWVLLVVKVDVLFSKKKTEKYDANIERSENAFETLSLSVRTWVGLISRKSTKQMRNIERAGDRNGIRFVVSNVIALVMSHSEPRRLARVYEWREEKIDGECQSSRQPGLRRMARKKYSCSYSHRIIRANELDTALARPVSCLLANIKYELNQ